MATSSKKAHAALVASPGMGHLIPTVELGKRLHAHHGFDVTILAIATDTSTAQSLILQQTSDLPSLNAVVLPQVDVTSKLPQNPSLGDRIALTIMESLPSLRSSLLAMQPFPSLLIVDLFGTLALPMARDLGVPSHYVFLTTSAWFTAVSIHLPQLDPKRVELTHVKNREPLLIPGCQPIRFEDTIESLMNPGGPMFQGFLAASKEIVAADGVLMNTWRDLEPEATKAVGESGVLSGFTRGPVYPVGPLVRTRVNNNNNGEERGKEHEAVMQWLDRQPDESVIFVSFGSGGTMSGAQMRELALGLELSMQRFVWVVRPPTEGDASAAFFGVGNGGDGWPEYLPEGFVERTREVGVVVPMWAPQEEILGHDATGGFVTHCGWNSVLEGIVNGVPMVAWPLYAEQRMNAVMLSEEGLGVAVRARAEEGGVVGRDEIARVVRRVMVGGYGLRKRVKELRVSGEKALCEVGSSHESLCVLRRECESRSHMQGGSTEDKAMGA